MPTNAAAGLDVAAIRSHFDFVRTGRVATNNGASTQAPRELVDLYRRLTAWYDNVHRGQSSASRLTTDFFESAYDTVAGWLNAPSRRSIVMVRNTTEAINVVMYTLMPDFRDGDNIVTTAMEHNSNFVPWYALCHDILPRFRRRVRYRVARFDPDTGELDLEHLASLVDERTKLVCCTGASNFLGTRPDLAAVRAIADGSGYRQPNGERRSLLLVDGAQLMPTSAVDVRALGVDYLAFSFHKMLAPFGVGVLYAKEHLLTEAPPFLYGGDMIAPGEVTADRVVYHELPWKYAAGTPNILGTIISAHALRLLVDFGSPRDSGFRQSSGDAALPRTAIEQAMTRIRSHTSMLTERAHRALSEIAGLTVFGPPIGAPRSPLVSFTLAGVTPFDVAEELDRQRIESRAGCHCASLAHHALGLDPPASCRLSFYLYNTIEEVDRAVGAVARIAEQRRLVRR